MAYYDVCNFAQVITGRHHDMKREYIWMDGRMVDEMNLLEIWRAMILRFSFVSFLSNGARDSALIVILVTQHHV